MKVAFPVIVLFAATASASDFNKLLGAVQPLIKKAKCASPCVSKIIDGLPCEGGPLTTICNNVDRIKKEATPCLSKCGIDKSVTDTGVRFIKGFCSKKY